MEFCTHFWDKVLSFESNNYFCQKNNDVRMINYNILKIFLGVEDSYEMDILKIRGQFWPSGSPKVQSKAISGIVSV